MNYLKIVSNICKSINYNTKKIEKIGEGGSGIVYKIYKDNNEYAIKILSDNSILKRFENEIKISKQLKGNGIIEIENDGELDGIKYYIMPFLIPLDKYCFKNYWETIECIKKIIKTLSYMASKGIFHRDIKPSNIVIDEKNNEVFLIDLGLIKDVFNVSINTEKKERIGSLTFIAPERIRPNDNEIINNEKADVYSLGMTIWSLLTKEKKGFGGQYSKLDLKNNFNSRKVDFEGVSIIEDLIEKCTSINPNQRPNFSEVFSEINKFNKNNLHLSDFYSNSQFAFRQTKPDYIIWENPNEIAQVLTGVIKRKYPLEILLYNGDGWLNLEKITSSKIYEGFIELYANSEMLYPYLMAPKYLLLANFEDIPFYILESKIFREFKKKIKYDDDFVWMQPVCELNKFNFTYQICYNYNDFNSKEIPKTARAFNIIIKGSFLIQLINQENRTLENIWEKHPELFCFNLPFSKKNKKFENRKLFKFHEVNSFKSRDSLLSESEESNINLFIDFLISQKNKYGDRININTINSYFLSPETEDYIKTILEISQQTVNNFSFSPFYIQLNHAYDEFNMKDNKSDYHINRHPEHSINLLMRKLYLFLYKYSDNQEKYYELFRNSLN